MPGVLGFSVERTGGMLGGNTNSGLITRIPAHTLLRAEWLLLRLRRMRLCQRQHILAQLRNRLGSGIRHVATGCQCLGKEQQVHAAIVPVRLLRARGLAKRCSSGTHKPSAERVRYNVAISHAHLELRAVLTWSQTAGRQDGPRSWRPRFCCHWKTSNRGAQTCVLPAGTPTNSSASHQPLRRTGCC